MFRSTINEKKESYWGYSNFLLCFLDGRNLEGVKMKRKFTKFQICLYFSWKGKLLYSCIEQIGKCTHFPFTISPFWRNWFLVAQEIFFPFTFISLHFLFVFQIKEKLYSTLNFLAPRKPPPPPSPKKKKG